jgi:PIN domain nuclease of toxin-antitoxin system
MNASDRCNPNVWYNEIKQRIQEAENFEVSPLGLDQLLCFKEKTKITEMHDRLIVCEALLNKARIITKDREIKDSGVVEVVW